jgi:site-specific DNA-methyltransferase (adenine-specific)
MTGQAYMPRSKSVEWETPDWLFGMLNDEFNFTVDAAASADNAKVERFWSSTVDGLKQDWRGETVWVNPPFSAKSLRAWTRKAYEAAVLRGVTTVILAPSKTDQDWWHLYALNSEIRFIPGRIKFKGASSTYPGPLAVLVFGPANEPKAITLPRITR